MLPSSHYDLIYWERENNLLLFSGEYRIRTDDPLLAKQVL